MCQCCMWSCTRPGTWQGALLAGDRTVVTRVSPHSPAETKHDSNLCASGKRLRSVICWDVWLSWGHKAPWAESLSEVRTETATSEAESPGLLLSPGEEEVTESCRAMFLARAPAQHAGNAPRSYSFRQSEKYIFAYVPPQNGILFPGVAVEVRKYLPLPGIFRNNSHLPWSRMEAGFPTTFCEGSVSLHPTQEK